MQSYAYQCSRPLHHKDFKIEFVDVCRAPLFKTPRLLLRLPGAISASFAHVANLLPFEDVGCFAKKVVVFL